MKWEKVPTGTGFYWARAVGEQYICPVHVYQHDDGSPVLVDSLLKYGTSYIEDFDTWYGPIKAPLEGYEP